MKCKQAQRMSTHSDTPNKLNKHDMPVLTNVIIRMS